MFVLASVFLLIGLLGVVIPILPGLPFLVVAALLFTANSPALRSRLRQSLRSRRPFRRGDDWLGPGGDGLTAFERVKLRTLQGLSALLPKSRQ